MSHDAQADQVRREARALMRRQSVALRIIEKELVVYGPTRHPLVDALLDVRNALRDVHAE